MNGWSWARGLGTAAGCALLIAGCGNLTSGGFGEVEVILTPGEVEEFGEGQEANLTLQPPVIEGTLTVRVRSFVRRGRADWVELTDGVQELTVSLDDPTAVAIARNDLPEGRYDRVRTIFERVEAHVERGLTVGGQPVTGTIRVEFGSEGMLSVVSPVDLVIQDRETAVIALEMKSGIWLRLANVAERRVLRDDFRQVIRVRVGRRP